MKIKGYVESDNFQHSLFGAYIILIKVIEVKPREDTTGNSLRIFLNACVQKKLQPCLEGTGTKNHHPHQKRG